MFKRITKNFIWLLCGNIVSQAIVFISFIKIASTLPTDGFGHFALAQAVINLLTRFTEFGLETIAVRKVTGEQSVPRLLEQVSLVRIILTIIVTAPLVIINISGPVVTEYYIMLLLSFSMIGISFSGEWYYLATENMLSVAFIRILRALIFYMPLVVFLPKYVNSEFVSWIYSISFIVVHLSVLLFFIYKKRLSFKRIPLQHIVSLAKESFPIGISNTLMQIPYYFGTYVIGIFLTADDVGNYSALYRPILALWSFGIMALYNAIFPIMNNYAYDLRKFSVLIYTLTRIFVVCGILLFVILYPLSETIIFLLYDGKYVDTIYVFKYSLLIISIVLGRTAIEYSLLSIRLQKNYTWGISLVSILYIILCSGGCVYFGIKGVLFGSILSEVIYTGYLIYQTKHYADNLLFMNFFIKSTIVASCAIAVSLLSEYQNPFLSSVVNTMLIAVLAYFIRLITSGDLNLIFTEIRK